MCCSDIPLYVSWEWYSLCLYSCFTNFRQGIAPILPIFREGILNGTPELKEQAAKGLGEVISLTSAAALRPFVVNITGPLIRILGDRFTWNVKVAVLQTLGLLLGKVCTPHLRFLFLQWFIFSPSPFSCMTGRCHVETFPSTTSNHLYQGAKRS